MTVKKKAAEEHGGESVLLSEREAAALLRVSRGKLRLDRQNGVGVPYIRFGRRRLYDSRDISKFLESNRVVPGAGR